MMFAVEQGTFSYRNGKTILLDVSFQISSGEILAVLGANGIGKTTLLKCMIGLLPWKKGRSLLEGRDIRGIPLQQLWQAVSYVPQAKTSQLSFTALDMVLIGRSPHLGTFAQPGREDRIAAQNALYEVGAERLSDKLCCEMSGGELQLVMIAKALAADPKLLILDEPESGLDFKNQLIILGLIRKLAKERGISTIINTHYPLHAMELADTTLMLFEDHKYVFGATQDIIDAPHMRRAFGVDVYIGTVQVGGKTYNDLIPLATIATTTMKGNANT